VTLGKNYLEDAFKTANESKSNKQVLTAGDTPQDNFDTLSTSQPDGRKQTISGLSHYSSISKFDVSPKRDPYKV